jgi:hypothetical protein
MITSDIQNILRAVATEHSPGNVPDFSTVRLITDSGAASIYLPAGTAAAVAACINVAVAAGQPAQIEADEEAA